ncbi:MAG: transposase [Sphingomonadaceae bacterium]
MVMPLTEGQASDDRGAALLRNALPPAKELIADNGNDGNGFRQALARRGIAACIPSRSSRKIAIPHDPVLYRPRHGIEILFGRLKDWRCIRKAEAGQPETDLPPASWTVFSWKGPVRALRPNLGPLRMAFSAWPGSGRLVAEHLGWIAGHRM